MFINIISLMRYVSHSWKLWCCSLFTYSVYDQQHNITNLFKIGLRVLYCCVGRKIIVVSCCCVLFVLLLYYVFQLLFVLFCLLLFVLCMLFEMFCLYYVLLIVVCTMCSVCVSVCVSTFVLHKHVSMFKTVFYTNKHVVYICV